MQRFAPAAAGWILAAIMVVALSYVCLLQWRSLREREHGVGVALSRGLAQIEQRIEVSNARWQSLIDSVVKEGRMARDVPGMAQSRNARDGAPVKDVEQRASVDDSTDRIGAEDLSALPTVPKGVVPERLVRRDLMAILADPVVNPSGKKLDTLESARVRAELVRAKSLLDILDSEIRLDYNLGMEELRTESEFIEYAPGQKYQTFEGVLTAGEVIPNGGMRMFYLYPERFPQVYEKKRKQSEIAEASTRKLLALLAK